MACFDQYNPGVVVGLLEISCRFEGCRSLKEKRAMLRPIVERIRNSFNASVCESGDQNLWGNAEISIAIAGSDTAVAMREIEAILCAIERFAGFDFTVVRSEVHRV